MESSKITKKWVLRDDWPISCFSTSGLVCSNNMQIQLNHSQINLPRILLSTENLNICGNGGKYVNMIRNHGSIVWLNIIINIIIEFRSDKRTNTIQSNTQMRSNLCSFYCPLSHSCSFCPTTNRNGQYSETIFGHTREYQVRHWRKISTM